VFSSISTSESNTEWISEYCNKSPLAPRIGKTVASRSRPKAGADGPRTEAGRLCHFSRGGFANRAMFIFSFISILALIVYRSLRQMALCPPHTPQ
jgi:hypothetical protein